MNSPEEMGGNNVLTHAACLLACKSSCCKSSCCKISCCLPACLLACLPCLLLACLPANRLCCFLTHLTFLAIHSAAVPTGVNFKRGKYYAQRFVAPRDGRPSRTYYGAGYTDPAQALLEYQL